MTPRMATERLVGQGGLDKHTHTHTSHTPSGMEPAERAHGADITRHDWKIMKVTSKILPVTGRWEVTLLVGGWHLQQGHGRATVLKEVKYLFLCLVDA